MFRASCSSFKMNLLLVRTLRRHHKKNDWIHFVFRRCCCNFCRRFCRFHLFSIQRRVAPTRTCIVCQIRLLSTAALTKMFWLYRKLPTIVHPDIIVTAVPPLRKQIVFFSSNWTDTSMIRQWQLLLPPPAVKALCKKINYKILFSLLKFVLININKNT